MTKLISLSDAISTYVQDGDIIYAAGFTHLIPFAAGHEIIRQGKRDLVLARATPDLIYDQMVAAGCARKVIWSYMGNPGVGSLRLVRGAVERGEVEWEEYSHFGMITRLQAGASGLPFLPMNQTGVQDLENANPLIKHITDPYGGKDVIVVPALNPDVAIVHVQRSDCFGNAHIWGNLGIIREAAMASRAIVLTVEEIVEPDLISSDPNRVLIPGFRVNAVVHAPWGAHPSPVPGYYNRDHQAFIEYRRASRTPRYFKTWKSRWVDSIDSGADYVKLLGGERLEALGITHHARSETVDYGY